MHSKGFARTSAERDRKRGNNIHFIRAFIVLYNISFISYKIM